MNTPRSDRIDAGTTVSAVNDDIAVQTAENEGMPVIGLQGKASPNVFDRISAYLRKEYASLKKGQDLTLEELFSNLVAKTDGDRLLRKQSAPLRFLLASDIKDARDFPIPGISSTLARPMRVWRQRYNGLGRFLPRPS